MPNPSGPWWSRPRRCGCCRAGLRFLPRLDSHGPADAHDRQGSARPGGIECVERARIRTRRPASAGAWRDPGPGSRGSRCRTSGSRQSGVRPDAARRAGAVTRTRYPRLHAGRLRFAALVPERLSAVRSIVSVNLIISRPDTPSYRLKPITCTVETYRASSMICAGNWMGSRNGSGGCRPARGGSRQGGERGCISRFYGTNRGSPLSILDRPAADGAALPQRTVAAPVS
jgi:hypothetical protein